MIVITVKSTGGTMGQLLRLSISRISVFFIGSLFALGAAAQAAKSNSESTPVYKPPVRGAPASRVGGGSRSLGNALPRIYVLAPQDIGFTSKGMPDIFWFVSGTTEARVMLSIYTDNPDKPVMEQSLGAISAPGIQRVRLSQFNLELKPRVEYRWRISLIDDASERSSRAIAGGAIQRVEAWPNLQARLKGQGTEQQARIYAEEGLWYDAIELFSNAIDAAPADATGKKNRASLLSQVGLAEVSRHDGGQ
jgi:hypothetical protein